MAVSVAGGPIAEIAPSDTRPAAVNQAVANLLPHWYLPAMSMWALVEIVALLAAAVLLAFQSSGEFYRGADTGEERMWHWPSTAG